MVAKSHGGLGVGHGQGKGGGSGARGIGVDGVIAVTVIGHRVTGEAVDAVVDQGVRGQPGGIERRGAIGDGDGPALRNAGQADVILAGNQAERREAVGGGEVGAGGRHPVKHTAVDDGVILGAQVDGGVIS